MRGCRALVAGFGQPAMRDLDFGRRLVDCLQQLDWPEGVVVEDLANAVPLVLDRIQELRPAKVLLLGAVSRDLDPPGTLRRYRPETTPGTPLELPFTAPTGIDHTLALARQWGGLPPDTVVIEVEPAETEPGLGFSEALAECIDPVLDLVREELDGLPEPGWERRAEPLDELLAYAADHADARRRPHAPAPDLPGLALAGRVRPWGVFVRTGGDWFDVLTLPHGSVGIVVGDVPGRGVEAAPAMADLRAAARAYAVLDGTSPAQLVAHLDRLAASTGLGRDARLLYLTLAPSTGEIRMVNAGGCPPLLVGERFADDPGAARLGSPPEGGRKEQRLRLSPESTMLVFTDGLIRSGTTTRAAGVERLRRAAVHPAPSLEALCDHVLRACTARRDDDVCLVALKLQPDPVPAATMDHGQGPGRGAGR